MISGFLNVNKPDGVTSFGVLNKIKKKFHIDKIGHLGTLDPAGTGVLPIAIGRATKFFDLFLNKNKVYRAIFTFGIETNTLDAEGEIINRQEVCISCNAIKTQLDSFIGEIDQIPPNFSAKKFQGKRAYDLAREKIQIDLKPKKVKISRFELIDQIQENSYLFEIECSSGTYIRSLCRDLAIKLGTIAYMPLIIRISAGQFDISNSISLDELLKSEDITQFIIPIRQVLNYSEIQINNELYFRLRNGQTVGFEFEDGIYSLIHDQKVFAIGLVKNKKMKMEIYLDD